MMCSVRVLFSTVGLVGHIHPLVPLAAALQTRGHVVRWATGSDGCDWVERAGFEAVSAGLSQAERWAQYRRRFPEMYELPSRERPDAGFGKLFGTISAPPALAALLPLVRSWRPELVVNDAAEFAAPIAAAVIGRAPRHAWVRRPAARGAGEARR